MVKWQAHKAKWIHNRAFAQSLDEKFPDWMATALFYAALHAVETLFALDGASDVASHRDRNQRLKRTHRYKGIWRHYRQLHDAARTARYDVAPDDWLPVHMVKGHLADRLYDIERLVMTLGKQDAPLDPIWS